MIQFVEMNQGNSRILQFGPVKDQNGAAVDLTNAAALWRLARNAQSKDEDIFLEKSSDVDVDPRPIYFTTAVVNSIIQWFVNVRLIPDDTKSVPPSVDPARWWYHELQVTDQNGNVDTSYSGPFILHPSLDAQ